ncbi:MAG: leucine-rich repeat domain-containing protein [Promethearchaeota archaeon]
MPDFKAVVSAIANQYFLQKEPTTTPEEAIRKAVNFICNLPYWKEYKEKQIEELIKQQNIINLEILRENISIAYNIRQNAILRESESEEQERPDIFISHSWNGPDEQLVEPLAEKLKQLGYNIWFDKEKGLEPGEIEKYFKDAITDSIFCIPIICKPYFEGKFTKDELQMLYKIKEKKFIIPIWYSDIDTKFLESQGELGKLLLDTAAILWDDVGKNIDALVEKIDKFIEQNRGIDYYNGVELINSETFALKQIEKIIGTTIPQLPPEAQKIANEREIKSLSNYQFGFAHSNKHVTALILKKIRRRSIPLLISGAILSKLRSLTHLCAPLIKLPPQIVLLKNLIELDIEEGYVKEIPKDIKNLSNLSIFLVNKKIIEKIDESFYPIIRRSMNIKYPSLDDHDSLFLSLLLDSLGLKEEIPHFDLQSEIEDYGYSSHNGKIIKLVINNKKIKFLPNYIDAFNNLTYLYLGRNKLSSLPESIGYLKNLQKLWINNNKLSSLPESIGQLTNLKELWIYNNQLSSLPESIGDLTNLKELYLQENELSSLPESIGRLTNLQKLEIYDNKLSSLPESIGDLTNLKELYLQENELSSLPEIITRMTWLKVLDIGGNQISSLPESIGRLTNLKELYLYKNKLSSLPESIGALKNLEVLNLGYNELSSLPESIGALKNLGALDLHENQLSSLPESIGRLTNLKVLQIYNNKLSSLPESIQRWLEQLEKNGCYIWR